MAKSSTERQDNHGLRKKQILQCVTFSFLGRNHNLTILRYIEELPILIIKKETLVRNCGYMAQ